MDKIFLTILNMSLTGSFVIAVICLARFPLKKAPKKLSYCLWAAAGFRLVFPFTIESIFSLIPFNAQTIPTDAAARNIPRISSGVVNNMIRDTFTAAAPQNSIAPLQILTVIGTCLWFLGVITMIVYGVSSYLSVKRKMMGSVCVNANLFEAKNIKSPFVFGIITPKIYIPSDLHLKEREYIILHEQTHIRRRDQITKFAAYLILCLHWFNPLIWAAFLLMGVDMEMSCDECVLKELGGGIKKDYSMSLLSLASDRRAISGSPLAFGEEAVKTRIKNVLTYRKPSRVAIALAVMFVTVLSLGLVVSRAGTGHSNETQAIGTGISGSGEVLRAEPADQPLDITHWDDDTDTISIKAGSAYDPDYTDSGDGANAGKICVIADYYNEDGKFSDLGLTLDGNNSERTLTVSRGDTLIAGDRQYGVTAQLLTLSFYTQPSHDRVIQWWTDYLDSWAQSSKVMEVN